MKYIDDGDQFGKILMTWIVIIHVASVKIGIESF